jgi:DNA-binding XRE family transcriptional regulator
MYRAKTSIMGAAEFRAHVARLGLTQQQMADWLDISLRTSHSYANGSAAVPKAIAMLLRMITKTQVAKMR